MNQFYTDKNQRHFQPIQSHKEPVEQPDIEQPEQPQAGVYLVSLAETPLDASVYTNS